MKNARLYGSNLAAQVGTVTAASLSSFAFLSIAIIAPLPRLR